MHRYVAVVVVSTLSSTELQVGCVGWWVLGGTMYLEERCAEKYTDMETCNLGGNLFSLHI